MIRFNDFSDGLKSHFRYIKLFRQKAASNLSAGQSVFHWQFLYHLHPFFISNTFISNTRLNLAKIQAKVKQHSETEFCYLIIIYFLHPCYHQKYAMILPWKFWIYSQLSRKSKTCFFAFPQYVFFLNWVGQNPNLKAFTSKIQVFGRPEWTEGGTRENEFWQFSNAKRIPPTVRAWKTDEKNGAIFLAMSAPWVMVLKLSKIVSFLQFFADVSKKI